MSGGYVLRKIGGLCPGILSGDYVRGIMSCNQLQRGPITVQASGPKNVDPPLLLMYLYFVLAV